jgi:RNA polymerase sigma factor (sigma-70 family)
MSNTATTVRMERGKAVITDGPFAETKEQVGGYSIVEAKDLDEVLAIVTRHPLLRGGSFDRGTAHKGGDAEVAETERQKMRGLPGGVAFPPGATMGIEDTFRAEHGRILATLIRRLGDFDVAEEALQEAYAAALEQWPGRAPREPGAWLVSTARHKAIDRLRRRSRLTQMQDEIARHIELTAEEDTPVAEDRLRLIFTCCHPALASEAQVALTLRTLGGLSTEEIARAFLVPTPTMAQRIVRAKNKIRLAHIPYEVPPATPSPSGWRR